MAASIVVSLPVILIYVFAQRQFVQGITFTGRKG
jgi:multiple sugar transport system permease protein